MKVFVLTLSGQPNPGDKIDIWEVNPSGGRGKCGYLVKQGDTLDTIAAQLVVSSEHHGNFGPGTVHFKSKGPTITMIVAPNNTVGVELWRDDNAKPGLQAELSEL